MAHVIVIGAGIGGMPMAFELRDLLGDAHRITVVSNGPAFQFVPSNPWLAVGWRARKDIEVDIAPSLEKRGIALETCGARRLHPEKNALELNDGRMLDYDAVVIATGPRLAFEEVEGLGPTGYTQSVCTAEHAEEAAAKWNGFVAAPGQAIVGAAAGASCFGPAYEFAFIMDADLRRRKLRDKVPMTFVTPEPYIGHLGLGGVGDSKSLLESALRERHIKWICNAKIVQVLADKMLVDEYTDDGAVKKRHELPFAYSMVLPAFKGVDAVFGIEGLTNPRGFILIDEFQRNPRYQNVYAVGVCVAIAPIEATPVPTGAPKTGFMIESMVSATAANIAAQLRGEAPGARATLNAVCLADFGDKGVAFVALPQFPPRNLNWTSEGKWVHLAKIAFEKYFIRKIRKGTSEPIYERYVMRALGIFKLKGQ